MPTSPLLHFGPPCTPVIALFWVFLLGFYFSGPNRRIFLTIYILTQRLASTWFWELVTAILIFWDKYLTDYRWANIRVESGGSIPPLLYAVFILIWDLLGKVSSRNKYFTMWHCLLSFWVFYLVADLLAFGTLSCIELYLASGAPSCTELPIKK